MLHIPLVSSHALVQEKFLAVLTAATNNCEPVVEIVLLPEQEDKPLKL